METAYSLFLEEAIELLPLIQTGLTQLEFDTEPESKRQLLATANLLCLGATQVKATELAILTTKLVELVQTHLDSLPLPDCSEQLWQIYIEIRRYLLTELSQNPLGMSGILAKGESVFAIAPSTQLLEATVDEQEWDLQQAILAQDVQQTLAHLEMAIANPLKYNLSLELFSQAEVIIGLGELLEANDFITIAQSAIALQQSYPQAEQLIAQRAWASWSGVYQAMTTVNEEKAVKPTSFLGEDNINSELLLEEQPQSSSLPLVELNYTTKNLFLWLAGSNLFCLITDYIAAIVTPQPEQRIISTDRQSYLWQSQSLPLYQLSSLIKYNCTIPMREEENMSSSSLLILIIRSPQSSLLALEIEIEQLIVMEELSLKPVNPLLSTPNYFIGCTSLKDMSSLVSPEFSEPTSPTSLVDSDIQAERIVAVIDVLALLEMMVFEI